MVKVSLVRCSSYEQKEVYGSVKKSIDLIGGLNIPKNSKVLIKPNLLRPKHPKFAVTTHPEVIRAIIKILKEDGCKIFVGDSPGFHDPLTTAKVCGILDLCKEEEVEFVDFKNKKSYLYEDALFIKRFDLTDMIDKVDYIINVPKLKTHAMMYVTLAVKNTFGFIVGLNKSKMHFKMSEKEKFASMLVDLNNFIKPHINIIDGIVGMEGNGPGNGTPKKADIISASYDSLAMDIVMCKIMGFDPYKIWTNKVGLKTREKDFNDKIEIVGEKLEDVKVKFKAPDEEQLTFVLPKGFSKIVNNLTTSRPVINTKKCKACSECIKICPAKTIYMENYGIKKAACIKKENCIRCFCCHEICPYDAIDIKKSFLGNFLEKLRLV